MRRLSKSSHVIRQLIFQKEIIFKANSINTNLNDVHWFAHLKNAALATATRDESHRIRFPFGGVRESAATDA
jgi:hypothetical protein